MSYITLHILSCVRGTRIEQSYTMMDAIIPYKCLLIKPFYYLRCVTDIVALTASGHPLLYRIWNNKCGCWIKPWILKQHTQSYTFVKLWKWRYDTFEH